MSEQYKLIHGDCLEVMQTLQAGSVDAVITDPPYGSTACRWDTIIPFDDMWAGIKRVRKPRAAVVLFGSEPFSSLLRVSNLKEYKYDWVWEKTRPVNSVNCNSRPLSNVENISIFYKSFGLYHPQMKKTKHIKERKRKVNRGAVYGASVTVRKFDNNGLAYPRQTLQFNNKNNKSLHPTQKPVPLMEYLIKTYTNEGDTVLDFTMGSGSTGVAAVKLGRKFIGIEQDAEYFAIAQERIANAAGDYTSTEKERNTPQMAMFWD